MIVVFGQLSPGAQVLLRLRSLPGKGKGFEISVCTAALHSDANEMARRPH